VREVVRDQLEVLEEYELPEAASEEDLAVAETILANLLVRQWLSSQQPTHYPEVSKNAGSIDS